MGSAYDNAAIRSKIVVQSMVLRLEAGPPNDLARSATWRMAQGCDWFHQVTSAMSDGEILLECLKRELPVQGRSLHDLQTALLQAF